ncbi:acylneuraminate cytidylyltransferase [Rubellicoccus peritrichatus]|uniref:N-acylneuraminate cytidylyltransferase n=1 Tax=Rubellicoccus peritrichatus TaxID=3080537 RepID=A0AAQ3LCL9_9BACT|nr:acylneuraminate cytidylyltransferase [Puniceicoccus sp. CR14]WOO41425.1 acylneuraminate cytidylyltransferase [Puniceicoccus sp. CR14]
MPETLAIIPARSGSKGVHNKNIRDMCGTPLLGWTISAAIKSTKINRVLVSTDSEQYAQIAHKHGAEAPFLRPNTISNDTASSESALLHALNWLQEKEKYSPEFIVFLQCTSPLTLAEDIDRCVEKLISENADSALTVASSHTFLWKNLSSGAEGINHNKAIRLRRQDMEPEFRETGAVYAMKTEGFLKHKHRFFGKTILSTVPPERSYEIDNESDWLVCESLLRKRIQTEKFATIPNNLKAIVFDFDGVFTDNRVWVDQNGNESVACSRSDGLRLNELKKAFPSLQLLILSKERNPVVSKRAKKLNLSVLQGVDQKSQFLDNWLQEHNYKWSEIIYVGNDLNDVEALRRSGCGIAVNDAYHCAKDASNIILDNRGGNGAVRELIDILLSTKLKQENLKQS